MPIQFYVDESGGKGQGPQFTFASLVAPAERWAQFSDEWATALQEDPPLAYFKMEEASHMGGEFRKPGWTETERDERVGKLGQIINTYVDAAFPVTIDLEAHEKEIAGLATEDYNPYKDAWVYGFQLVITCAAFYMLGKSEREPCEIIFDQQNIFSPRAQRAYPWIKAMIEADFPAAAAVLPGSPMFQDDKEFLPLQAADTFAWPVRRRVQGEPPGPCNWIFAQMEDVGGRPMEVGVDMIRSIVRGMSRINPPAEVLEKYREIYGNRRGGNKK